MNSQADVLSDVLSSMRICGSLLLHESYSAPWAVSVPDAEQLSVLLEVETGVRVVAFHLVERGHIEITPAGGCSSVVEAGEMAICFGGYPHQISQGANPKILPMELLMTNGQNPFRGDDLAGSTSCVCGVFLLHDTHLNPLFAALPPLLHAMSQTGTHNFSRVTELVVQEINCRSPGSSYVVERLLELLCAEAVRSHLAKIQMEIGWLTGLRDPIVNRALTMIHSQPGASWSVKNLAQGVAMSPSRFTATLGESPMGYVSKWRMNVASRLLDNTEKGIGEIAGDVGYESLAAFNRAFKRHLSLPPGAWRSRRCS